jgi:hypothetical protein
MQGRSQKQTGSRKAVRLCQGIDNSLSTLGPHQVDATVPWEEPDRSSVVVGIHLTGRCWHEQRSLSVSNRRGVGWPCND